MNFITQVIAVLGLGVFVAWAPINSKPGDLDQEPKQVVKEPQTSTSKFFNPSKALNQKVDSIYNSLNNKQRAAQMIMYASSTSPKLGYPYTKALDLVKNEYVGNILFLKGHMNDFTKQVKELNQLPNILKPIYACDCEPTLMNGKWQGSTPVQKAPQQKTETDIEKNTQIIVKDMKKVGVQINFAPVADNSLNKAVISTRAFGSDAKSIVSLSKKFIEVSQNKDIAASVKHFPGHGNVLGDSHKNLVYIDGEMKELNTFKQIIQGSTPPMTVLVGHIAIRNNAKWGTNGLPSTISKKIVTDLLRKELGYEGVITTDAMNMMAVAKIPDADWKAVEAGVDLVVMPTQPKTLNKKIVAALEKNDALSKQLEASIKRVIRLKVVLGIL